MTLTRVRRATSARLRGLALPEAFANATVACLDRRARHAQDSRRAITKAARVLQKGNVT